MGCQVGGGLSRGSFSVHNLSHFGLSRATAVIAPSQRAALSYGAPSITFNPATV